MAEKELCQVNKPAREKARGVYFSLEREPLIAASWRTRAVHTGEMRGVVVPERARFAVVTEIETEEGER